MANVVKRKLAKLRDKALAGLNRDIQNVDSRLGRVEALLQEHITQNRYLAQKVLDVDNQIKSRGNIPISDREVIAKIFSGIKMSLDPRDIAVAPHLILDTIWESSTTYAWLSQVQPTATILDIGANFGYFGALAAQRTSKKHSRVIFFEANRYLIPYIRKTLSMNWLNEQSIVENLAVTDKPGEVTLNLLKDYVGSSSLQSIEQLRTYMSGKMEVELAERVPVPAVTIDGYCKEHQIKTVDLIKMDIEGYEELAYGGMRRIIKASPNVTMFVEFTKDSYKDPQAFYELMLHDFGHVYLIDENGKLLKPRTNTYENVIGDADDWVMPVFSKKGAIS